MSSTDGLPLPRRYWAMLTVALAVAMSVLDTAIANVALPTIAADVRTSPAASIWVVNAYQLAVTVSLLPLASLGELYGYRRVYQIGLAVFTFASFACALSSSLAALTAARILQGLGAAGIMSVNGALIRAIYPRRQLGRGIGLNAMVVAVSSAAGPAIAAAILSLASWPWLFAVNVPIGMVALAIAAWSLPGNPRRAGSFDYTGAALSALSLGLLVAAIDGLGRGEDRWIEAGELALAAAAGVLLVRRQLAVEAPLLPIDLLRLPVFRLSIATSVCSFVAQTLAYVSLPFLLQETLGHGVAATGLLMTAWPLTTAMAAPIAGRLADRVPSGLLGGLGLVMLAVGLGLLATMPAGPATLDIVWRMAVCGLGFGVFQTPNNRTIITSAPPERSGGASGMLATARLLGQTTGAATVALIFGLYAGGGATLATSAPIVLAIFVAGMAAIVSLLRLRHQL